MREGSIPNPTKLQVEVEYFDETILFECENENTDVNLPSFYGLSPAGTQILQHLKPQKDIFFMELLRKNYKIPNYKIHE